MGFRHSLFSWLNRKTFRHTEQAWRRPLEAQRDTLRRIVHAHKGAGYLQHHVGDQAISDPDAFRRLLPIVHYKDLQPWISPLVDHGSGAPNSTVAQPVSLFLKTSGTTGPAKLLPVTPQYEAETGLGRKLWTQAMLAENDLNGDGSHVSVISPMHEGFTPGGIPFGSNTGRIFKQQMAFIQFFAPVPYPIFSLKDFELRYYLIARFAADRQDVRTFTTANPSTVLLLCRSFAHLGLQIADDIEAGRICDTHRMERLVGADFGPLIRTDDAIADIRRAVNRSPRRAKQLRQALAHGPEGLLPRMWPKLTSVNCWLGGHAPFYTQRLSPFFHTDTPRRIVFRDPGLLRI